MLEIDAYRGFEPTIAVGAPITVTFTNNKRNTHKKNHRYKPNTIIIIRLISGTSPRLPHHSKIPKTDMLPTLYFYSWNINGHGKYSVALVPSAA